MTKTNANRKVPKGQKTMAAFVVPLENKKGKENKQGKENEMGLSSNLRKSSIRRSKSFAYAGSKKGKNNEWQTNTQTTIDGKLAEPRCDEGTKICSACAYKEKNNKNAHFAHDSTCTLNTNYKKTDGGRISMAEYYLRLYEEERQKELKRPFSGDEVHNGTAKQADVDDFLSPTTCLPCADSSPRRFFCNMKLPI